MHKTLYHAAQHTEAGRHADVHALATQPPAHWPTTLNRGLGVVAALLLGCGLIFWIAANWGQQTRGFKLVLIQAAFALSVLAALLLPKARHAALLATSLCLGGWLAFIGQSYQTGADAWQLFALWAALSLIWTWPQRSDLLWSLWVVVAAVALSLWTGHMMWLGDFDAQPLPTVLLNMGLWGLLPASIWLVGQMPWTRLPHGVHGLPQQAWRVAMGVALAVWCGHGVAGWWSPWLAMALCGLAGVVVGLLLVWRSRGRDFVLLALAALALNIVGLAAVARVVFDDWRNLTGSFLVMSVISLLALGGTVKWLLKEQANWEAA